jgi:hypothetical protein
MIEIVGLSNIRQGRVGGLVERVIEAEDTMKQEQCRLFPQRGTVTSFAPSTSKEQAHTFTKHA